MTLLWLNGEPYLYDETVGGIQWIGGVPIFLPQEEQAPVPTGKLIPWTLQAKMRIPAAVGAAVTIPDSVVGKAEEIKPPETSSSQIVAPAIKEAAHPY